LIKLGKNKLARFYDPEYRVIVLQLCDGTIMLAENNWMKHSMNCELEGIETRHRSAVTKNEINHRIEKLACQLGRHTGS